MFIRNKPSGFNDTAESTRLGSCIARMELIQMKVVASEGTSRSFAVWRKCVLSQLIMGFVHNTLTLYKAPLL